MTNGIVPIVLGLIAFAVIIAVTVKYYRKMQRSKGDEAKQLEDYHKAKDIKPEDK